MNEVNPIESKETEDASLDSALVAAAMPWAFTQHHPLDTSEFIREAKRRGFDLDLSTLRDLYRHQLLIPFVALRHRRVSPPIVVTDEPSRAGTRLAQLREARNAGKLQDLAAVPFMSRLPFDSKGKSPYRWWNGLLYSQHQLLALPTLKDWLGTRYHYKTWHEIIVRKRVQPVKPDVSLKQEVNRFRRIAIAATALEARYLPTLDPEWVQLTNANPDEWKLYRSQFDPVATSNELRYTGEQARQDAEHLLFIAHRIDPVGSSWSQLIRRAPRDSWKELKDAALSAMDLREAAEILLCFYEDLARRGVAEPLPTDLNPRMGWHPLHERLSERQKTLDQDLMHLGISPHPRVVLAVEGDSEELHAPKIWKALEYPDAPELIRVLNLGGTSRDVQKVAALAAAPLVGRREASQEFWWLIKPPTRFMVAADPENNFSPSNVDKTRGLILDEIKSVLKAQGVKTKESELEELVEIRTWSQSCYEFAHFTDEELADGITESHPTCNGWSRDDLVAALAYWRARGEDIKQVWKRGKWDAQLSRTVGKWDSDVSKTKLAEVLWPVLEQKIQLAKADETALVPEIVEVMQRAYFTAQNWRYKSFVLTAAD